MRIQLAQNHNSLGINPSEGFLVAGESNGADIALAIAHLYADEVASPPLTGLYLAAPEVMNTETVPDRYRDRYISPEQNVKAPIRPAESLEFIRCEQPAPAAKGR